MVRCMQSMAPLHVLQAPAAGQEAGNAAPHGHMPHRLHAGSSCSTQGAARHHQQQSGRDSAGALGKHLSRGPSPFVGLQRRPQQQLTGCCWSVLQLAASCCTSSQCAMCGSTPPHVHAAAAAADLHALFTAPPVLLVRWSAPLVLQRAPRWTPPLLAASMATAQSASLRQPPQGECSSLCWSPAWAPASLASPPRL